MRGGSDAQGSTSSLYRIPQSLGRYSQLLQAEFLSSIPLPVRTGHTKKNYKMMVNTWNENCNLNSTHNTSMQFQEGRRCQLMI